MKQLIKGTAVIMDGETIENVLIGEPSADGRSVTLGIPKGDAHVWSDKTVRFFGRNYRTKGLPEQGIEENIPLCWHKKIRAELLDISGSITVYENETFRRHVFEDVFFCDLRGEKITGTGSQTAGAVSVKIYSCSGQDGYRPRTGDMIVLSGTDFEFDTSDQQTVFESINAFRTAFPEFCVVKEVSEEICGELPDIIIAAR